jgi:rhodanese-related sulfurtransferase
MNDQPELVEISVETLAQRLATEPPESLQLIDVREPQEVEMASVPGFQIFSLSQHGEWSGHIHDRLDPRKETIVMCHHGMRSAQMCYWLMTQGFTQVKNLAGGIHNYSIVVDPSIPQY